MRLLKVAVSAAIAIAALTTTEAWQTERVTIRVNAAELKGP